MAGIVQRIGGGTEKKIGKLAVTGIITMLTAIWGMVSFEMAKNMKREIEGSNKDGERSNKETDKR